MPTVYAILDSLTEYENLYQEHLKYFLEENENLLSEKEFLEKEIKNINNTLKFLILKEEIIRSEKLKIFYNYKFEELRKLIRKDELDYLKELNELSSAITSKGNDQTINKLSKIQSSLFFHYLQEIGVIKNYGPVPLSELVEHLTGFKRNQLYKDGFSQIRKLINSTNEKNINDLKTILEVFKEAISKIESHLKDKLKVNLD